jgi:hypothetical protein
MAVIGIEFTSAIAQVIFTLLLLAAVAAAVWLVRRLRRSEANLETVRRENAKLRNEVGNITGWTANGRLPEDWQDKLRSDKAVAPGSAPAVSAEAARQPVLLAAHHALVSVEPPHFASSDSADEISRAHKRIVDLIEGLAAERIDPVPALANGDMDRLFCLWRRLEGYFPDRAETDAYGLAAYAVLELLKRRQVQVKAPRPLSVESVRNCVFTTDDSEKTEGYLPHPHGGVCGEFAPGQSAGRGRTGDRLRTPRMGRAERPQEPPNSHSRSILVRRGPIHVSW